MAEGRYTGTCVGCKRTVEATVTVTEPHAGLPTLIGSTCDCRRPPMNVALIHRHEAAKAA